MATYLAIAGLLVFCIGVTVYHIFDFALLYHNKKKEGTLGDYRHHSNMCERCSNGKDYALGCIVSAITIECMAGCMYLISLLINIL